MSVVLQLAVERTGLHPVARTCFRPPPNVDSALVAFRRTRDWDAELERLGVWPRRRSRTGARRSRTRSSSPGSRTEQARGGRARRARPPRANVRAEDLAPDEFLRLGRLTRHEADGAGGRGEDQPRARRRAAPPDGLHEVATVLQRIDLCDRIELEAGEGLVIEGFPEDTIVAPRSAGSRRRRASSLLARPDLRRRSRSPPGLGGGSADAAAALRLANASLPKPLVRSGSTPSPPSSARTSPSSSSRGRSSPKARASASPA